MIRASRDNAVAALRSGAVVIVFPGGDNDAMRPTWQQSTVDFSARTGYVATALEARAPIAVRPTLAAFVVLKPGESATADVPKQYVREHLRTTRFPVRSRSSPSPPACKIMRQELKAHLVGAGRHD